MVYKHTYKYIICIKRTHTYYFNVLTFVNKIYYIYTFTA